MNFFIILLILTGCSLKNSSSRTDYNLNVVDDFLISNIYSNSNLKKKSTRTLELTYDLILKNTKDTERQLDLTKALLSSKTQTFALNCLRFDTRQRVFKVTIGEQFRVQCSSLIQKEITARGDTKLVLMIPLENETARFQYIVREEDFK